VGLAELIFKAFWSLAVLRKGRKGSWNLGFLIGIPCDRCDSGNLELLPYRFICKLINLAVTTRVEEWAAKGRPKRGKTPHSHNPDSYMLGLPD